MSSIPVDILPCREDTLYSSRTCRISWIVRQICSPTVLAIRLVGSRFRTRFVARILAIKLEPSDTVGVGVTIFEFVATRSPCDGELQRHSQGRGYKRGASDWQLSSTLQNEQPVSIVHTRNFDGEILEIGAAPDFHNHFPLLYVRDLSSDSISIAQCCVVGVMIDSSAT